jgi:hypothetical protein
MNVLFSIREVLVVEAGGEVFQWEEIDVETFILVLNCLVDYVHGWIILESRGPAECN